MTRSRRGLVVAVGAWLALAIGSPAGSEAPALVAAHRGGAALWAENSLHAFRNAIALGVDALEFDLHQTADGEVVVLHDPTLERTTTGRGAVRDLKWADLAAVKLRGPDGTVGVEPLAALTAVLDLAASTTVELMPEIKVDANGHRYDGIEEKVLALLRSRGLLERATVQAFQPETIRRLRQLEPRARTMFLMGRGDVERMRARPAEAVRRARELGATDLGMNHRLIDADVVAAARDAGIRLSAWTVNEEADIQRMLTLGVGVIMSDRPDLVKRLRGR